MKRYIRSAIVNPLDENVFDKIEIARSTDDIDLIRDLYAYATTGNGVAAIRDAILYKNPNTPMDIIEKVVDDEYLARVYACNGTCPDVLAKIARKYRDHRAIPTFLAQNPNVPSDILVKYLNDYTVRGYAAMNPGLSDEMFIMLANDSSTYLRGCVALNPGISPELLTELAEDPDEEVRQCVAQNSNTPIEVLQKLTNDSSSGVCIDARCTLREKHNL
jgi:hypothetical protein